MHPIPHPKPHFLSQLVPNPKTTEQNSPTKRHPYPGFQIFFMYMYAQYTSSALSLPIRKKDSNTARGRLPFCMQNDHSSSSSQLSSHPAYRELK